MLERANLGKAHAADPLADLSGWRSEPEGPERVSPTICPPSGPIVSGDGARQRPAGSRPTGPLLRGVSRSRPRALAVARPEPRIVSGLQHSVPTEKRPSRSVAARPVP